MRYLLFVFRDFYPIGGAEDLAEANLSLPDLLLRDISKTFNKLGDMEQIRANILDCKTLEIVAHYSDGRWFTPEEYKEHREEY